MDFQLTAGVAMPGQSFSRDKQEHALLRAVEVGDAVAAEEAGVRCRRCSGGGEGRRSALSPMG